MTRAAIRQRATLIMMATSIVAAICFAGAILLSGEHDKLAWVWIVFGLINVFMYWMAMRIYRRAGHSARPEREE